MLFYSLGFILESVIPGTDIQRFHSLLYTKNMERDIGDEAVMVSRYMCDDDCCANDVAEGEDILRRRTT